MKKFLFKSLLIILLPYFVYASDGDSGKKTYYSLKKELLRGKAEEREKILNLVGDFATNNRQILILASCKFKPFVGNQEDINNQLNKIDFLENYGEYLSQNNLSFNEISRLYFLDKSSLSDECNEFNKLPIIQIKNNLVIPIRKQLIFFQRLPKQDEKNINDYNNNVKCLKYKQVDMETTHTCYYKNMTILDVYNAMYYNSSYVFRKKIKAGENFSAFYEDYGVDVEYKWSGKNKLEITQYFQGGVTYYTFIYQNDKTKLIKVHSPD